MKVWVGCVLEVRCVLEVLELMLVHLEFSIPLPRLTFAFTLRRRWVHRYVSFPLSISRSWPLVVLESDLLLL